MTPDQTLARALAAFRSAATSESGAHSAALDLADAAEVILDAYQQTSPNPAVRASIHAILSYCWADEQRDYEQQDDEGRTRHIFRDLTTTADWLNTVTSSNGMSLKFSEPNAAAPASAAALTAITRVFAITGMAETVTDSFIGHHRATDRITLKTVTFTPDRLSVHYARRPDGWTWISATVSDSVGGLDDSITFRPWQARPIPGWVDRIIAIHLPL